MQHLYLSYNMFVNFDLNIFIDGLKFKRSTDLRRNKIFWHKSRRLEERMSIVKNSEHSLEFVHEIESRYRGLESSKKNHIFFEASDHIDLQS